LPSTVETTTPQLARLVGTPEAPVIIDVRIDQDVNDTPQFLAAAFQYPFNDIELLAPKLANKAVVIYCHKGKKISQGAAALLCDHGIQTEPLVGSHFGWSEHYNKSKVLPQDHNSALTSNIGFDESVGVVKSSAQTTRLYSKKSPLGKQVLTVVNFPPGQIDPFISACLSSGFHNDSGEDILAAADGNVPNSAESAGSQLNNNKGPRLDEHFR